MFGWLRKFYKNIIEAEVRRAEWYHSEIIKALEDENFDLANFLMWEQTGKPW